MILIPDHSQSAKYREWSGIIKLKRSKGYRFGDVYGQRKYGIYLARLESHL
jgi:hypothetical protein